jgi:hypothetical protein
LRERGRWRGWAVGEKVVAYEEGEKESRYSDGAKLRRGGGGREESAKPNPAEEKGMGRDKELMQL